MWDTIIDGIVEPSEEWAEDTRSRSDYTEAWFNSRPSNHVATRFC